MMDTILIILNWPCCQGALVLMIEKVHCIEVSLCQGVLYKSSSVETFVWVCAWKYFSGTCSSNKLYGVLNYLH